MAYRARRSSTASRSRRTGSARSATRRPSSRRTGRSSGARRVSSGARTVRIEIVQPTANPIARPFLTGANAGGPVQGMDGGRRPKF